MHSSGHTAIRWRAHTSTGHSCSLQLLSRPSSRLSNGHNLHKKHQLLCGSSSPTQPSSAGSQPQQPQLPQQPRQDQDLTQSPGQDAVPNRRQQLLQQAKVQLAELAAFWQQLFQHLQARLQAAAQHVPQLAARRRLKRLQRDAESDPSHAAKYALYSLRSTAILS